MIRRVMVQQDEVIQLRGGGELGVVTEQALVRELVTWAAILDRMGGHLRVTTHRVRNPDVEGEAFTVGAMVEWVDRTDDPRPAPEQEAAVPAEAQRQRPPAEEPPAEVLEPAPHPSALLAADEDDEEAQAAAARAAYAEEQDGVIRDGDGEPVEDLTSIPASAR